VRILPRDCKFRSPLLLYPTDAVLRGRVVRFHSYTSELGFIQQFDADDAADQDTTEGQPAAELNLVEFGPLTEQEAAEEQLQEECGSEGGDKGGDRGGERRRRRRAT